MSDNHSRMGKRYEVRCVVTGQQVDVNGQGKKVLQRNRNVRILATLELSAQICL